MSESLERRLVMDALEMAYLRRKPGRGLIHHSDRGSRYAGHDYRLSNPSANLAAYAGPYLQ